MCEIGGPAAGGQKFMLQKCYLNNKTAFNEVLRHFFENFFYFIMFVKSAAGGQKF
jgi:hypothetical protein